MNEQIQGIDWTVAIDREQFYQGGCGMCLELTGTGVGSGGNPVTGVYHVFVNNQCPECEFGHLDVALPGDGLWDITWCVPALLWLGLVWFVGLDRNELKARCTDPPSSPPPLFLFTGRPSLAMWAGTTCASSSRAPTTTI